MADENGEAGQGAQAQGAAAGQGADAPPLAVTVQYIKDLSFENPRAPQSFGELTQAPEINVDIDVEARQLQQNVFEVTLQINAKAEREGNLFFVVELAYGAVCVVGNVPPQHIQPLVMIEGPRLMFPFARSILADAVRDGGYPPLLINPIDFARLYQRKAEQSKQDNSA